MITNNLPAPTRRIAILEPLTEAEQARREHMERLADAGFAQAFEALAVIRSDRLYRSTHPTFEAYCADRFGRSARWGRYMASAVEITQRIAAAVDAEAQIEVMPIPGTIVPLSDGSTPPPLTVVKSVPTRRILPTAAAQLRPLASVAPEAQVEVWNDAAERAGGVPTAKQVQAAVDEARLREQVHSARYALISQRMTTGKLTAHEALVVVNALDSIPAAARPVVLQYDVRERALIHELGRLCKAGSATYQEIAQTGYLQFADGQMIALGRATAQDLRGLLDERRQEHLQAARDAKIDGTPVSVVVYIGDPAATVRALRTAGFVERDLRDLARALAEAILQRADSPIAGDVVSSLSSEHV